MQVTCPYKSREIYPPRRAEPESLQGKFIPEHSSGSGSSSRGWLLGAEGAVKMMYCRGVLIFASP